MSPTIFRHKNYRFFFFSREESRMHVHVMSPEGEAKFWMEPLVSLSGHIGFKEVELRKIQKIIEDRQDEIKKAWKKHFKN